MNEPAFLLKESTASAPADLERLKDLVESYKILEGEIADLEARAAEKKKVFTAIAQEEIPALLHAAGLSEIKLATGEKIKVTEGISVSIADRDAFFDFLKKRGEDSIVKTAIELDRMEPAAREKVFSALYAAGVQFTAADAVNGQTLKKYAKDLIGVGRDPEEVAADLAAGRAVRREDVAGFLKIFTYWTTKIK